jgi:hypothetical protein
MKQIPLEATQSEVHGESDTFNLEAELRKLHREVMKDGVYILMAAAVGSDAMMYLEGWDFCSAFYFVSLTMTTVGLRTGASHRKR